MGADLGRDAADALDRTLSTRGLTANLRGPSAFELPETQAAVDARLPVAAVDHMETETGFVVRGTRVAAVVVDARLPPCALDQRNFPALPPILNYSGVHNQTDNRHGIGGYLNDPRVAGALA